MCLHVRQEASAASLYLIWAIDRGQLEQARMMRPKPIEGLPG
jgi:hypothetical protein